MREQLAESQAEIERLEQGKKTVMADVKEMQREVVKLKKKLADSEAIEKEAVSSEQYMRQELGNFALEVARINDENRKSERDLAGCRDKVEKLLKKDEVTKPCDCTNTDCGKSTTPAGGAVESAQIETLVDKIANCEETVKGVRERCESDQATLKQLTKTHEQLVKASGNCTEKLKECDTQKGYLEFLKKGYDVVVQELEQEAKVAKDDKERSDKEADIAIKGIVFGARFPLNVLQRN